MTEVLQVCIPNTLRDCFDYLPNGIEAAVGCRVQVPFRNKIRLGIVTGQTDSSLPADKLKPIAELLDKEPILSPETLKLCHWVSQYYQSPLSEVLPLALPKKLREGKHLKPIDIKPLLPIKEEQIKHPLPLNEEQALAVEGIAKELHHYHCFLLYGVTGSGKTEVYLQTISKVLAQGLQVMVLVPEIGLTPQLLKRFQERFDYPMAVIHSGLNETERSKAWQLASAHQVGLVIGTRAAVFTPMPKLGLIIIDEEHDNSLKQMEGVRYSARDTALMRAHTANIPVILGSATPSLETLNNARQGKFTVLHLHHKALNQTPLQFQVVDLRNNFSNQGLAAVTLEAIKEQLAQKNQVLIFINRRGFSPVLFCQLCAWIADCPACDSHLTFHRQINRLICHHCGYNKPSPPACKKCHSPGLLPLGTGTQRLEEFLQTEFADYQIMRVDRDEVSRKNELSKRLELITRGEAQLIVGTQMLAKGHHFPNLSLVVIADADGGFFHHDFRAVEQLGQLLTQVSGRAGRADRAGKVIIQTHVPQNPYLNLLIRQGYDAFADALLQARQAALLPPYHYLALIRAQGRQADKVMAALQDMKKHLLASSISVLGPAPAPMARKGHQHRMQLLLKSQARKPLQHALTQMREWLTMSKAHSSVRWNIDIDPLDLS
ncbi:Primosomal protein N' (replication factor Y) [Legionella birminghamensis]|uniref:Replication restart protein PriA n=1 Tax=Legionella birminghamensis TaxID=28083 RepID=A0A378I5N3_9GAMM|nr:primosomal protein N' [Legionella birminghamensis]KTC70259.1 Primosomal protein N' (replication factor Y) [Legionella birminghamensis]STX30333.1 Primosomal protein N' (replication factor Y) [Legionella birminghamensis]